MSSAIRITSICKTSFTGLGYKLSNLGYLKPNALSIWPVRLMSLQKEFEDAKIKLSKLSEDPGNEAKLKVYGLFKQATEGPIKTKRPGITDFVGRAKWDAWSKNGDISKEEAQKKYIEFINSLAKTEESEEASRQESGQKYKTIKVEIDGGLRKLTLNRPTKFNALNEDMYKEWIESLKEADKDPKTVVTAVTGAGSYYCSGNDLSNFTNLTPDQIPALAEASEKLLNEFVSTFIDFPKPLVAVVNGPAVGIAVTLLPLFDAVYSSDRATFNTPFSALGQSPEGCSSVIFPRLMGYAKASQMLLFNKKVTAEEAHELGIVTEVFPDMTLQSEIWPRLKEYSKLPPKSLFYSKELIRGHEREFLHKINDKECERLKERWQSEDCANAVMAFFTRKSK